MYEECVAVEIDRIFRDIRTIDYSLDVCFDKINKSLYDVVKYDLIKYIFCIAQDDTKATEFVKLYLKCEIVERYKPHIDADFDQTAYILKKYITLSHKENVVIKKIVEILETICRMYIIKMEYGSLEKDKIKERSRLFIEEFVTNLKE